MQRRYILKIVLAALLTATSVLDAMSQSHDVNKLVSNIAQETPSSTLASFLRAKQVLGAGINALGRMENIRPTDRISINYKAVNHPIGQNSSFSAPPDGTHVNADPDKAKFITSDVNNFWRAFDLAEKEIEKAKKINIFQTEYLDKGSTGLQDFLRLRIKSAKDLVETIELLPRYYAAVRPSTLRVAEMEKNIRRSFCKFKRIYPNAVFPDVYFVIGIANTGGTASENGLLIGTELYGVTANTPRDEFPALFKNFLKHVKDENELREIVAKALDTALKPIEKLPFIVAHESCHFNQNYPKQTTLLEKSIQEGSCDLIAELTAGDVINPSLKTYGDRHEAKLWRDFQMEMNGKDLSLWMYNSFKIKDRPGDLGYYMGYKISKEYYRNAKAKKPAINDILNIKDFNAFFEKSRYREKFAD
jgi:hypothetical protein